MVGTCDLGRSDGSGCEADTGPRNEDAGCAIACRSDRGEKPQAHAFLGRAFVFALVPGLETPRALQGSADDVVGVEVFGGEVDDPIGVECFAGVHVDREEEHGLVPGVEVRA
jgi:hypothetical protein